MWSYIKDGAIKQTNNVQTRLEINSGSYFPVKYANEWTKERKETRLVMPSKLILA